MKRLQTALLASTATVALNATGCIARRLKIHSSKISPTNAALKTDSSSRDTENADKKMSTGCKSQHKRPMTQPTNSGTTDSTSSPPAAKRVRSAVRVGARDQRETTRGSHGGGAVPVNVDAQVAQPTHEWDADELRMHELFTISHWPGVDLTGWLPVEEEEDWPGVDAVPFDVQSWRSSEAQVGEAARHFSYLMEQQTDLRAVQQDRADEVGVAPATAHEEEKKSYEHCHTTRFVNSELVDQACNIILLGNNVGGFSGWAELLKQYIKNARIKGETKTGFMQQLGEIVDAGEHKKTGM